MQELIEAVRMASQSSPWEIALVIAPIIISVLALFISLYIAHRQNKIALFEKRYRVVYLVKKTIEFSKLINNENDNEIIFFLYQIYFKFNFGFELKKENGCLSEERAREYVLLSQSIFCEDLFMTEYLFNHRIAVHIEYLINVFEKFMIMVVSESDCGKDKEDYMNECKEFEQKHIKELYKIVSL